MDTWRAAPTYVETHGAGATATTNGRKREAGKPASLRGPCCGGTKKAGDSWTKCDVYGDVTLCNECWRVIQPIWVLSADEKKKLQEEGRTFREIVFLNAEVTALQSQTFEE